MRESDHAILKYYLDRAPVFMNKRRKFLIEKLRKFKEYFITSQDGQKMAKDKVEELREEIAELKNKKTAMDISAAKCSDSEDWWWDMVIPEAEEKIKLLERKLWKFNNMIMVDGMYIVSDKKKFNLEEIKEIPIDYLLDTPPKYKSIDKNFYRCPLHNEENASFV